LVDRIGDSGWATTLHQLWQSAVGAGNDDNLSDIVYQVLLEHPGVTACIGILRGPDGHVTRVRWTTRLATAVVRGPLVDDMGPLAAMAPVEDPVIVPASERLPAMRAAMHDLSADCIMLRAFPLGSGESGVIAAVVRSAEADLTQLRPRFAQVVDVAAAAASRIRQDVLLESTQGRDALLAEVSLQLDAVLDVPQTLEHIARTAVPAVAEGCLVYLIEGAGTVLRTKVHMNSRVQSIMDEVADSSQWLADTVRAAIVAPIRSTMPPVGLPEKEAHALGVTSLTVTPLRARGRILGALLFLYRRDPDRMPETSFLDDLALRAALAIDNAKLYALRRDDVVTLQRHLLPARLPEIDGVEIAAAYKVGDAQLDVGGDFYDVVQQPKGCAAIVGDVCGRGAEAAALTSTARHTLATLLEEGASGRHALTRLNDVLRRDGAGRFVTCAVASLQPYDDNALTVRLSSAGHTPSLVVRRTGEVEHAPCGGTVVGVFEQSQVGESDHTLAPGDTLLLLTDGLSEARDSHGRLFEAHGLLPELARLRSTPVSVLVESLCQSALAYRARGSDDIAVLAIRPLGSGARRLRLVDLQAGTIPEPLLNVRAQIPRPIDDGRLADAWRRLVNDTAGDHGHDMTLTVSPMEAGLRLEASLADPGLRPTGLHVVDLGGRWSDGQRCISWAVVPYDEA
jgi:GAF domain-containing protein